MVSCPLRFRVNVICVLGAVGLRSMNRMIAVVNIKDHSTDSGPAQILPYTDPEEIKLCKLLQGRRSLKLNILPYSFYLWRDLRPLLLSKVLSVFFTGTKVQRRARERKIPLHQFHPLMNIATFS